MMRPDKAQVSYRVWSEPSPEATVLLVPGWRCQADVTYVDVLAYLEAGLDASVPRLKVILPDTRGIGGSTMGQTTINTFLKDELGDKAAILDKEKVGPVIWVGHSMGGRIGYEQELNAGDGISTMVTVCAPYTDPLKTWGLANRISEEQVMRVVHVLEAADMGKVVMGVLAELGLARRMALRVLHNVVLNRERIDPTKFRGLAHHALEGTDWRTIFLPLHAMRAAKREPIEMQGVRIPVIVLAGGHDRFVRQEAIQEIAGHMPQAQFRLLSEVGHVPPLEAPGEVAQAVIDATRMIQH